MGRKLLFVFYGRMEHDHLRIMQKQLGEALEGDQSTLVLNLPEDVKLEIISLNDDGEEIPEVVVKHEPKIGVRKPKWV